MSGSGSAAGSGFDLYNEGEGPPLSQELDLGESAAAGFSGAGASSPIAGVTGFFKSLTELKIINFIK